MILSFFQIMGSFALGFILTHMLIYKLVASGYFAGKNPLSQLFNTKG
jgi:hypothetical protein